MEIVDRNMVLQSDIQVSNSVKIIVSKVNYANKNWFCMQKWINWGDNDWHPKRNGRTFVNWEIFMRDILPQIVELGRLDNDKSYQSIKLGNQV